MAFLPIKDHLEPPDELDGAEVIFWAYSPIVPFFIMEYSDGAPYKSIHGFAICRYPGDSKFYMFSCDHEWNVTGDFDADSIEEAQQDANSQTQEPIDWNRK